MSYSGEVKRVKTLAGEEISVRHGEGELIYGNGLFSYNGSWMDGQKHGTGVFTMKGHMTYSGDFVNGEMDGDGTIHWFSGGSYSGQFVKGLMQGQGIYNGANGEVYEGGWKNNLRKGNGDLRFGNGDSFRGLFKDHFMHFSGLYKWGSGATYDGEWSNGRREGKGNEVMDNGDEFRGSWENDERSGHGFFHSEELGLDYDGLWEHGQPAECPSAAIMRVLKPSEEEEKKGHARKKSDAIDSTTTRKKKNAAAVVEPVKPSTPRITTNDYTAQDGDVVTLVDMDSVYHGDIIDVAVGSKLPLMFLCVCDKLGNTVYSESGRQFSVKISVASDELVASKSKSKKKSEAKKAAAAAAAAAAAKEENGEDVEEAETLMCFCDCEQLEREHPTEVPPLEVDAENEEEPEPEAKKSKKKKKDPKAAQRNAARDERQALMELLSSVGTKCIGRCAQPQTTTDAAAETRERVTRLNKKLSRGAVLSLDDLVLAADVEVGTVFRVDVEDVTFPCAYEDMVKDKPHPASLQEVDPVFLLSYDADKVHPALFKPQPNTQAFSFSRDSEPVPKAPSAVFRPLKSITVLCKAVADTSKPKSSKKKK